MNYELNSLFSGSIFKIHSERLCYTLEKTNI